MSADLPALDVSHQWKRPITPCVSFCVCSSLSVVFSGSIHTVVSVRASLLFMAQGCFQVWRDLCCCISEQNLLTLKLLNVSSHVLQILL